MCYISHAASLCLFAYNSFSFVCQEPRVKLFRIFLLLGVYGENIPELVSGLPSEKSLKHHCEKIEIFRKSDNPRQDSSFSHHLCRDKWRGVEKTTCLMKTCCIWHLNPPPKSMVDVISLVRRTNLLLRRRRLRNRFCATISLVRNLSNHLWRP